MWIILVLMVVSDGCDLDLAREAQSAYAAGRYSEAETRFRTVVQQQCGTGQKIANWSSLASALRAQGKFQESDEWFARAYETAGAQLAKSDPVWPQLLNSYALLDDDLGRVVTAESKFRRALELGAAANVRTNLARLYTRLGRLEEAARLQEAALSSERKNPAQWMNLAAIRRRQGRDAEAEDLLRQALQLSERASGNAHPYTIAARSNLAQVLAARGDHAGALKMMQMNIDLWARTYGVRHPTYAKLLTNQGALLFDRKKYAEAAPLFREALEINTAFLGARHVDVAKNLHDLGALHHAQGQRVTAEEYYRGALAIYGEQPGRLDTLANFGILYQQWRRFDDAERCYQELLAMIPRVMPSEEARVGKALESYEQLLRQRREVVDAERVAMVAMRFKVRTALRAERFSRP